MGVARHKYRRKNSKIKLKNSKRFKIDPNISMLSNSEVSRWLVIVSAAQMVPA
jgi:hypothetical protein